MVLVGTVAVMVQWFVLSGHPGAPLHIGMSVTVALVMTPVLSRSSTVATSRKLQPVMVTVVGFCVVPAAGVTLSMVGGGSLVTRKAMGFKPPPPSGLMTATS